MHNERKIKNAYKKAMFANHPDKGGSKYIALKLSEAKDYLLATIDSRKENENAEEAAAAAAADAEREGDKSKGDAKGDGKGDTKKKGGPKRR